MIVQQILELESGIVRASNPVNSHHAICVEDHTKRCQVSRATLRVEDDGTLAPKSQLLRISQSRSVPVLKCRQEKNMGRAYDTVSCQVEV